MRTGEKGKETPACNFLANVVGERLGAAKRISHSQSRKTLYHKGAQRTRLDYRNLIIVQVSCSGDFHEVQPKLRLVKKSLPKAGRLSPIPLSK